MKGRTRGTATGAGSLVRRREVLSVGPGGLRLGVVADTHGAPHRDAERHLRALAPHHLLHAGDVGDLGVLEGLRRIAPLTAVRGNIDGKVDLPDVVTLELRAGDGPLLTLLLVHIAVYGPKLRAEIARLAQEEGASLVVCGHSHVPFMGRDRGVALFNPGSIGPRRFALPIVFGVIDVSPEGVKLRHVDCETGEPWRPGPAPLGEVRAR